MTSHENDNDIPIAAVAKTLRLVKTNRLKTSNRDQSLVMIVHDYYSLETRPV